MVEAFGLTFYYTNNILQTDESPLVKWITWGLEDRPTKTEVIGLTLNKTFISDILSNSKFMCRCTPIHQ